MKNLLFCSNCGIDVEYNTTPVGPHLKAVCSKCGKYLKFVSYVPIEMFVMPFGKYKGITMVAALKNDRNYFEWLFRNTTSKSIKHKIVEAFTKLGATPPVDKIGY